MIEEQIEIRTAAGTSDAVLYVPAGDGPWPGAIHLTDIGGIRPAQRDMARRLAAEGYVVLMPNLFYRTARPPVLDRSIATNPEAFRTRFQELTGLMTPEALESDASAYVDFLAGRSSVKPGAKLGVAGYCYSGGVAMRIAAARPDKIGAAASFHGGRLVTDGPESPHLLLPRIQARLYFAHAVKDNSMPQEAIETLNGALEAWGGQYASELYEGAYHSWTAPDSPLFNQPQADRAFHELATLFASELH